MVLSLSRPAAKCICLIFLLLQIQTSIYVQIRKLKISSCTESSLSRHERVEAVVIFSYISCISQRYWDAVMNVVALKPSGINKSFMHLNWLTLPGYWCMYCRDLAFWHEHGDTSQNFSHLPDDFSACWSHSANLELLHQKDQVVLHWSGSQKLSCSVFESS